MKNFTNATYYIADRVNGYYPDRMSSWNIDFRGANKPKTRDDMRPRRYTPSVIDTAPTIAKRELSRIENVECVFEGSFAVLEGNGFFIGFFDDEKETFKIVHRNEAFYYGDKKLFDCPYGEYYIRFEFDLVNSKVRIYFDRGFVGEVAFEKCAHVIDMFAFGFGKEDIGNGYFNLDIKMYSGYYIADNCVAPIENLIRDEYEFTKEGNAELTYHKYSPNEPFANVYEIKTNNGKGSLKRKMPKTEGTVAFRVKYLIDEQTDGTAYISLTSGGKKVFTVKGESTKMTDCEGHVIPHNENVFEQLRFVVDPQEKQAVVYINGRVGSTCKYDSDVTSFDGVEIEFESTVESRVQFCDIMVFPMIDYPEDYVPAPVIPEKRDGHMVGINMCTLWREGHHGGWDYISAFEEETPMMGFYDEGVPETEDWEIKWFSEHGIDYGLFCWYASESNKPFRHCLHMESIDDGFKFAKYSENFKIALLWEAMSTPPASIEAYRKYFVPYFLDYFFADPRCMQTPDGKAIMSIFAPTRVINNFGGPEETKKEFDYLREKVKELGYTDLIIMCCGDSNKLWKQAGIDAIHAYGYGRMGYEVGFTKSAITNNMKGDCHVVPTVSTGYNSVAWQNRRWPTMEPSDMETLLTWIRDDILPNNEDGWKQKLVSLSNWNEYGEGTYICPAKEHGFGYVDAVRRVFLKDEPHEDFIPTEAQKKRVNRLYRQDRKKIRHLDSNYSSVEGYKLVKRYEFKTKEDLDKWEFNGDLELEIKDGKLYGHSNGDDPYMLLKDPSFLPYDTKNLHAICTNHMGRKEGNLGCALLYYCSNSPDGTIDTDTENFMYSNHKEIVPIVHLKDYPLFGRKPWKGEVTAIRVDPIWAKGDFIIESIDFYEYPESWTYTIGEKTIHALVEPDFVGDEIILPMAAQDFEWSYDMVYLERRNDKGQFKLCAREEVVFTEGSDIAQIGDEKIKLLQPFYYKDGLPMVEAKVLARALGMKMEYTDKGIVYKD